MNHQIKEGTRARIVRAGTASILAGALTLAGSASGMEQDMQAWIDEQIASGGNLAITAMQLSNGEVRYFAGGTIKSGEALAPDENTQFQMGSITKPFTDMLLAELVAAGKVRYDSTIGELMSASMDKKFEPNNPAVANITLQQLATHTSGLPRLPANLAPSNPLDPYADFDEALLDKAIMDARNLQPLGNHYAYSNFGVGLLGHLLGQAQGEGYQAAMMARVIKPLGLEETGFEARDNRAQGFRSGEVVPAWNMDALAGAGALWGSTSDFARLAQILLGSLPNPLKHDLAIDREIVVDDAGGFELTRVWHVGHADDAPIYWHNGGTGGYWSFFGFRPDTHEAVAILVAGDTEVTGKGLAMLGHTPRQPETAPVDESLFGQYALNENIGIGIYEMNGQLVGQLSGQPPLPITPVGDDWYAVDVADASLQFVREAGQVSAVKLAQNGHLQTATRVADTAQALSKASIDLPAEKLAEYTGEYALAPGAKFTIRMGDDTLEAQITGQPYLPIFAKGDDVFFYKVVDAELHFERDAAGQVIALVLHQGQIVQRAEKL